MDILGPVLEKTRGSQFVVVMTGRCTKPAEVISTVWLSATMGARDFLEQWVSSYGIPSTVVTHNGTQFLSRYFVVVWSSRMVNNFTAAE